MSIAIDENMLLLSSQRALLFSITPSMRYIFIELTHGVLKMLVYAAKALSEDELDLLYSASGEICGDFVSIGDSEVLVVVSNKSYNDLEGLQHLVYAVAA